MYAGMAVRLAFDLGIHLDVGEEAGFTAEDRRLNRLLFWSVVLLDFALAFGTGRTPTIRVPEVTQLLPTDEDMGQTSLVRHPFPYAVELMFSYGRLIELLNMRDAPTDGSHSKEIQKCKMGAFKLYSQLPKDMRWSPTK